MANSLFAPFSAAARFPSGNLKSAVIPDVRAALRIQLQVRLMLCNAPCQSCCCTASRAILLVGRNKGRVGSGRSPQADLSILRIRDQLQHAKPVPRFGEPRINAHRLLQMASRTIRLLSPHFLARFGPVLPRTRRCGFAGRAYSRASRREFAREGDGANFRTISQIVFRDGEGGRSEPGQDSFQPASFKVHFHLPFSVALLAELSGNAAGKDCEVSFRIGFCRIRCAPVATDGYDNGIPGKQFVVDDHLPAVHLQRGPALSSGSSSLKDPSLLWSPGE